MVPLRRKNNDKRQVGTDIPNGESVGINFSPKNSDNGSMHYFSLFLIDHVLIMTMALLFKYKLLVMGKYAYIRSYAYYSVTITLADSFVF